MPPLAFYCYISTNLVLLGVQPIFSTYESTRGHGIVAGNYIYLFWMRCIIHSFIVDCEMLPTWNSQTSNDNNVQQSIEDSSQT